MKIAICSSMVFSENMLEVKAELERMGHSATVSARTESYAGHTQEEKEGFTLRDKNDSSKDVIAEFWEEIKGSDAILVLNYDRRGIAHYIGGNTLMEIGFAHVLKKKIFLLNPIPDIQFYQSEIEAVRPVILNGDLTLIGKKINSPKSEGKMKADEFKQALENFPKYKNFKVDSDKNYTEEMERR